MDEKLIYLASPYSDPNPHVREARFKAVCRCAAILMARGVLVFSPIAHCHPITCEGNLPKGFDFWGRYDRRMIEACDEVAVLIIEGFGDSVGVLEEMGIARDLGKVVWFVDRDGNEVTLDAA